MNCFEFDLMNEFKFLNLKNTKLMSFAGEIGQIFILISFDFMN